MAVIKSLRIRQAVLSVCNKPTVMETNYDDSCVPGHGAVHLFLVFSFSFFHSRVIVIELGFQSESWRTDKLCTVPYLWKFSQYSCVVDLHMYMTCGFVYDFELAAGNILVSVRMTRTLGHMNHYK